ncbi:MAG: hypothetical protein OEX17_09670 [Rhodospirillaceae bacterium]|nr:hypothetical protein [Rhodospirillaceae bacterium]
MKKLSSRPDQPPPINRRTNQGVPIPPARNNGRDENFPDHILRKSICLANALSFAAGDCSVCTTPDACKNMVGDVMNLISELHK